MTTTTDHTDAIPAVDEDALARSGDQIRSALDLAGDRIPHTAQDRARSDLEQVDQRLRLGVGHTVVALVGGTGSGKSSLFNAISGLEFADVGVIRPTTAEAAACTWGGQATELLDFLGVAPTRRIQRESVLDHDEHTDLRGLVLLDLPDHDSVEQGHARQVDRLLPLVDLLIWVVDPQKYADNVLHEGYLRALTDRQEAMLVLVNQIDTIPRHTEDQVHQDVTRLLAEGGLDEVQVLLTSVRAGRGLDEVRERIGQVTAGASVAARTARAQLDATAAELREHIGPAQPQPDDAPTTAENLATASGVAAVSESIRTAVTSPRPVTLSPTQRPARSRIDAIRERWLAKATAGTPQPWQQSITAEVPPAQMFYRHVCQALDRVPLPDSTERTARRVRIAGQVVLTAGILALLGAAVLGVLAWSGADADPEPLTWVLAGSGAAAVIAGVVLRVIARRRRRTAGAERAASYLARVEEELRQVVTSDLIEPTRGPLADHDQVRQALTH